MSSRSTFALAITALVALAGCGASDPGEISNSAPLTPGTNPAPTQRLDSARGAAERFSSAYAGSIYDPSPPQLPAASTRVDRAIRSDATRIPPPRLGHSAHAAGLLLAPESPTRVRAAVTIADGHSPRFSVGFTLSLRRGSWLITAISAPD